MTRTATRSQCVLMFLFLYLPYIYFNHSDGWNQGARFAELHAIVMRGTLAIDAYHEMTGDKAALSGHYYSEKAPAVTLMALPAFSLTVLVQRQMGIDPDSESGRRVSDWTTTAGSVALIAALGGVAFFSLLRQTIGHVEAHIGTFALFLGSLTFPYAGALFAHAATIGWLAMTMWSVLARRAARARFDLLGGVFAGLAIASEYPAVFPVGCLLLYLGTSGVPRAIRFAIGMLPALMLILLKNYAITGSPLAPVYGFNPAFAQITSHNAFGFGLPDLETIGRLAWGEYRGLLYWSPVLAMAIPGLVVLANADRALALAVGGATVIVLLQAASFIGWHGGNSVGPRYLTPAIPLLGLGAAFGIARFPRTGAAATLASMALMGMVAAVAIDPPQDVAAPLRDFYLVRLQQDRLAPNLGVLLGLTPGWGLLLLAALMAVLAALIVWTGRHQTP